MVDAFRPLTLLLGGAALWALCLLVLALGGLGTRFSEPGLESPPRPVPKVSLTAMHSRLGAIDAYAEVGSRPLMNQNRQPTTVTLSAQGASNADLDVTLSSVLITSNLKLALLTDNKDNSSKRVKLGDVVEGSNWRLVNLEPRQAVLEGPGGQKVLPLRVFDGASGEAPTPVAGTDAAQPPAAADAPPRSPPPPPVAQNAAPPTNATVSKPDPNQMTQEQQVEAIRARIEARRAQMRAEAESAAAANHQQK